MNIKRIILWVALVPGVFSCSGNQNQIDASGTFEAEETIISAEASGVIRQFDVEEGQSLKAGQETGYVDSLQLHLKREQLEAQIRAVLSRRPDAAVQVAGLREQLKAAEKERARLENLVKADAATPKQLDDVNAQIEVLGKQIDAQLSALGITANSISQEAQPLYIQIRQLEDQIAKCRIVNPVEGTVLVKYARAYETTAPGKPLYKIANLSTLTLRAYFTGDQLAKLKLGQKLKIKVDSGEKQMREYEGVISWVSDKAEFTPKTIQTKDERANLVYAARIRVKNDGFLKLGMYGEVIL